MVKDPNGNDKQGQPHQWLNVWVEGVLKLNLADKPQPGKPETPTQKTEQTSPNPRWYMRFCVTRCILNIVNYCANNPGVVTAIATMALVGVGAEQWLTYSATASNYVKTERAFVFLSGVSIAKSADSQIGGAVLHFYDSGSTPARDVMIDRNFCTRKDVLPKDFTYPSYASPQGPTLFPPKFDSLVPVDIGSKYLNQVTSSQRLLYVWGNVTYKDVFGVSHQTEFCVQYTGSVTINGQVMSAFEQCGTHNCADESCHNEAARPNTKYGDPSRDCPP